MKMCRRDRKVPHLVAGEWYTYHARENILNKPERPHLEVVCHAHENFLI